MAIKVLIVDDSMVMRRMVSDIIKADPEIEVVGNAKNGEIALEKTKALQPDVVLLDIEMPVMTGFEYLEHVKAISTAKVVVLSSQGQAASEAATKARSLGAEDVVPKPSGGVSLNLKQSKGSDIVEAIRKAAGL